MLIDYTEYAKKNLKALHDNTIAEKQCNAIKAALNKKNIHGKIKVDYYENTAIVYLNEEYYNAFDYKTGCFFAGYVFDLRPLAQR
jgi:hypothetical protein